MCVSRRSRTGSIDTELCRRATVFSLRYAQFWSRLFLGGSNGVVCYGGCWCPPKDVFKSRLEGAEQLCALLQFQSNLSVPEALRAFSTVGNQGSTHWCKGIGPASGRFRGLFIPAQYAKGVRWFSLECLAVGYGESWYPWNKIQWWGLRQGRALRPSQHSVAPGELFEREPCRGPAPKIAHTTSKNDGD